MLRRTLAVVGLSALAALVIVLAMNPVELWPWVGLGILFGLPFTAQKLRSRLILMTLGILIVAGWFVWVSTVKGDYLYYITPKVPVAYQVTATFDSDRGGWRLEEKFTLTREALRNVSDPVATWLSDSGSQVPDDRAAKEELFQSVQRNLKDRGWILAGGSTDGPIFERIDPQFVSAPSKYFPPRALIYLPLTSVTVYDYSLSASKDSTLALIAPSGMVYATDPPSSHETIPGDRQISKLNLAEVRSGVSGIEVEQLSPIARYEPIRTLSTIAFTGWIGMVFAGAVALIIAFGKDKIASWMSGIASKVLRVGSASVVKTDPQLRKTANRARSRRRVAGRRRT